MKTFKRSDKTYGIGHQQSTPEYFGLMKKADPCWLHGFEVDLAGRVLLPELRPDNSRTSVESVSGAKRSEAA